MQEENILIQKNFLKSLKKMFRVFFTQKTQKDLKKLHSTPDYKRIQQAIREMYNNPFEGDIKKLKAYELCEYRKRVGNYRILFELNVNEKSIIIHRIVHRKDAYKNI